MLSVHTGAPDAASPVISYLSVMGAISHILIVAQKSTLHICWIDAINQFLCINDGITVQKVAQIDS